MRPSAWILAAAAASAAAVAGAAVAAAVQDRPSAYEGFREIQQAARGDDPKVLEARIPPWAGKGMVGNERERISAWRKGLAAALAKGKEGEAREEGDEAVVGFRLAGSEDLREMPLKWDGERWTVAAPLGYIVRGRTLDRARGRAPAEVLLKARSENSAYGPSAYSFAHVTQDPAKCLNRMDLWYCHNGDLHVVADGRIARVAAAFDELEGLPLGAKWKETLAPAAGGVYVVHCRREQHRDFYVKMRVKSAEPEQMEMEWTLLAAGFGWPSGIQAPQPLVSGDGADGYDGLCGKGAKRSEPEPEPGKAEVPPEGK